MPLPKLPGSWSNVLRAAVESDDFRALERFVAAERARGDVYPPAPRVFAAFEHTPFDRVKVVLLGQDPYHGPGQAHGLCLSVRPGVTPPPSLRNIYKELESDLGIPPVKHGYLVTWARRGV